MTGYVARMLFPLALMVAAALWAKGYAEVGDGFSAGATAGLGAALQYLCLDHDRAARIVGAAWAWRILVGGLVLSVILLLGPTFFGVAPVTHIPRPGEHVTKLGVLELHTAALFDLGIAAIVYGAFVGTFDRLFPLLHGDEP